ncbi:MAG: acetoin utilization protein AcuC [Alphaproteobacteria bacterium]|nr:acetoin utilization protein AcuC [Alphaproteobacteria bacterium]
MTVEPAARPVPAYPGRPLFVANDIYRHSSYGGAHPLAIPRVSATVDLARALGWLDGGCYWSTAPATRAEIARFHDPAYIAALERAERDQALPEDMAARHNLGRFGNPFFPEMFRRPATSAGAVLTAADVLLASDPAAHGGRVVVYSPPGGTHHARHDRANGFCYFNDPVLGMLRLLDGGMARLLYIDLDAHHCDGVEAAFHGDPRVLMISTHEERRWPFTGAGTERAGGSARNLPVPRGFNDSELDAIVDEVVVPLGRVFAPDAVVVQSGADALADDPLSRLELSNGALWRAVAAASALAPRVLVVGGGGYNPWSVARAWAGVWGTLNGRHPPSRLPEEAETVLRGLMWQRAAGRNPPAHWFTTLADAPRPGPVRDEVKLAIEAVLA